jgi:lambda repressor-like predicted transcriptional regulator
VIAATIIKVTNDLIFGMHGFSIATIANKAKCSEYAMKTMLKKAYPYGQDIY